MHPAFLFPFIQHSPASVSVSPQCNSTPPSLPPLQSAIARTHSSGWRAERTKMRTTMSRLFGGRPSSSREMSHTNARHRCGSYSSCSYPRVAHGGGEEREGEEEGEGGGRQEVSTAHGHRHRHTQTQTHTDTQTNTHTDTHSNTDTDTHRQRDRQTDRQTDRHIHTQTDRQTDRHTHTHTHLDDFNSCWCIIARVNEKMLVSVSNPKLHRETCLSEH